MSTPIYPMKVVLCGPGPTGAPIDSSNPVAVAATQEAPNTTDLGYATPYYLATQDETKRTVKIGAANMYGFKFVNTNTTPVRVNLYDALIASVTVGSTVPVERITIPAGDGTTPGQNIYYPDGRKLKSFATGIVIAAVAGLSDSSSAALTNDIEAEITFK